MLAPCSHVTMTLSKLLDMSPPFGREVTEKLLKASHVSGAVPSDPTRFSVTWELRPGTFYR